MDESPQRFDQAAVVLLDTLLLWRLRAVEHVELSSAFWAERNREIHIRPLQEVMQETAKSVPDLRRTLSRLPKHIKKDGREYIDLVLPITELPKIPLLDLTLTAAGSPIYRLSRDESARIQARHIIRLANRDGLLLPQEHPPHFIDFLTFLFFFPAHAYEETLRNPNDRSVFLGVDYAYLKKKFPCLPPDVYLTWKSDVAEIFALAKEYVLHDYASGAENPIISLPYLHQELKARKPSVVLKQGEVTDLMAYLREALTTARKTAGSGTSSREFLSTYFAYGHRWMSFARCTVPLDDPFIITAQDKRAIYFSPERRLYRRPDRRAFIEEEWKKEVWQMVAFADAETNHVSIRVSDTAVRLHGKPDVFDELKNPLTCEVEEEEHIFELYLRQDSTRGRKERFYISTRLRLTRLHSWMLWLTMIVTGFGLYLLLNRGVADIDRWVYPKEPLHETANELTAKDATLILVPVAFAAAFLLIRDTSTLSARIRRVRQSILMAELFLLLVTAFALIAMHHIKVG